MRASRATRVRQITALKELGLSYKEIGARLGLEAETCRKYFNDPEGLVNKRSESRKKRPCECGRNMISSPKSSRCWQCNNEALSRRRKRWTQAAVIGALQRYYFEHGEIPTQEGVLTRNQGHYCGSQAVANAFGSWSKGLDAAGFPPRQQGPLRKVRR